LNIKVNVQKVPDLKVAIPHLWFQILVAAVTYKPRSALCILLARMAVNLQNDEYPKEEVK
jgi:hypothetical protein